MIFVWRSFYGMRIGSGEEKKSRSGQTSGDAMDGQEHQPFPHIRCLISVSLVDSQFLYCI